MESIITPEISEYLKANYLKYSSRKLAAHCKMSKSPVQKFLRDIDQKYLPKNIIATDQFLLTSKSE